MNFAWVKQHTIEFSMDSLCQFMRISQSARHAGLQCVPTTADKASMELAVIIENMFKKSWTTYDLQRFRATLSCRNWAVNRRVNREVRIRFYKQPESGFLWPVRPVPEGCFHTFETDLAHHQTDQTRNEARQAVFKYIEVFGNRKRHHSAKGYGHPWSTKCRIKRFNPVSGKVLTHH
jgi:hypothetical protein